MLGWLKSGNQDVYSLISRRNRSMSRLDSASMTVTVKMPVDLS